jgi:hypothetical protein
VAGGTARYAGRDPAAAVSLYVKAREAGYGQR